ncbi:MAG: MerR family transcriptional regulator, partial [Eubacteriales bacterium]|nr:MerR family transcriptional regulator [Eubacteriales bacterium]
NETAKQCNLTKKAIEYYLEQGLINPAILENGYRDFSKQDLEKLKQIALYRKLDLKISEIKHIFSNSNYLKCLFDKKTLELEEEKIKLSILQKLCNGESVNNLEQEINEINSKTIIIKKLVELFPSYYGKFISLNFSRYLTGKIETAEQMQAFSEIIDFFDSVSDIDIPKDLQEYLDNYLEEYSSDSGIDKINAVIQEKEKAFGNIDEFVVQNREILEQYKSYKETDEFKNSPANRLMLLMQKFCSENGYYQKFIPAMRKLSPLYNEYYEQMLKADKQFSEKYPELL